LFIFLSIFRIKEICQKVIPGVKVTNPFTAAILALKTLNASPIALVTPYRNDLNLQMKSYFENEGIEVKAMISFNEEDDNNVGRISQDSIEKAALEIGQNPEAHCSNLLMNEK
jgi:maleate isomerase